MHAHARTEKVNVGRTAVKVTRLGLGAAPLGNLHQELSEADAIAIVQTALENGTRFIDTAPLYGRGASERRVGAALRGVPRDSYTLSTKVGRLIGDDGSVSFDFSRDGVRRSLDASLQRLGVDRVDIALVHDPDSHYQQAVDEAFPTLADLRAQGVVRAIGAGMNQWQMEADFVRAADPDCFLLAGRYTLLEQTALDFLDLCRARNIGVFLGGVYNSGILARGPAPGTTYNYQPAPPAIRDRVARLQEVCAAHGVPLRTVALAFARAHPAVTSLVVGADSAAQFADTMALWDAPVPAALWVDLGAAGLIADGAPTP